MKGRKQNLLLLLVACSMVCMELLGIWVEATSQTDSLPIYQPGVTYACLYLRDLSLGEARLPFAAAALPILNSSGTDAASSEERGTVPETDAVEEETKQAVPATVVRLGEDEAPPEKEAQAVEAQEEPERADSMELESEFVEVDESYFDDALFIGDSRVVGLGSYAPFPNATYAAAVGLSIYTMFDKKIVPIEGSKEKKTVRNLLTENQYGKIYIKVGVNELGTGTEERFRNRYREALDEIAALQPNAVIFVQSVLHVSAKKSKTEQYITNENIDVRNEGIAETADGKRIFYLDINPLYDAEGGCMDADYTGDGVHIKAMYYDVWKQYLMQHGIVKPQEASDGTADPSSASPAGQDETGIPDR